MFQDLVESDIFYAAIFENENTLLFNKDFWRNKRNLFPDLCPEMKALCEIVKVYETETDGPFLPA